MVESSCIGDFVMTQFPKLRLYNLITREVLLMSSYLVCPVVSKPHFTYPAE